MSKLLLASVLTIFTLATSGCVPVAIGAGAAIGADAIAEDNGGDLF